MSIRNEDPPNPIVARFESDWKSGNRPWILEFLADIEPDERESALSELIAIDIQYRKATGEKARSGDYLQLGPDAVGIAFQQLHESFSSLNAGKDFEVTAFDQFNDQTNEETLPSFNLTGGGHSSTSGFIGPYELIEEIGEGGMGTVWMAEQHEPVRRRVALKVIRGEIGSEAVIARFEAERQAIALMEHQNIAKILDAGTTESGSPYFAMELVDGVPLNEYCVRNKLGIRQRLELMIPVCRAIHHAHQKGIIHRDLKHSNVLVTQYDGQPVPKVIDFGLAKAFEHENKLTEETIFTEFGRVVGTLQYMSPEQAEMNSMDVDTRTDIYALGVMIYKLLTGTTPLDTEGKEAKTLVQVLQLIREQDPLKPSDRLASFERKRLDTIAEGQNVKPEKLIQQSKSDVDWIVMKAIEKDRERRYESANGLALDIERFLANEEVRACPPSTMYRVGKFYKRNKKLVYALSVIAMAVLLGVVGTAVGFVRALHATAEAQASQAIAETRLQANLVKSAYSDWQLGNVESAWQMLNSLDKDKTGWESDYLKTEFSASEGEGVLYGHAMDVVSIDASADGRFIASTSRDHTVRIWDAKTKLILHTVNTNDLPYQVCFSPDSQRIAYVDRTNQITLFDPETGGNFKSIGPFKEDITCIAFFKNGKQLVVGTGDEDLQGVYSNLKHLGEVKPVIRVVEIDNGSVIAELKGHTKTITAVDCSSDGQFIVSCGLDSTIRIWRKDGDKYVAQSTLSAHYPEVRGVDISPADKTFVSCGKDSTARLWDLETGNPVRTFIGHRDDVNGVGFNSDGSKLVSGSTDGTARIWNLRGEELLVHQGHFSEVTDACFSSDDSEILTASTDKTVRFWNSHTNTSTLVLKPHQGTVWQAVFSPDGKRLITVSEDETEDGTDAGSVCIIDPKNGQLLAKPTEQRAAVLCVAHSPVDDIFVTGGADSVLRVFDSKSGQLVESFNAHDEDYLWDVDFSPDGKFLVTASSDHTFKIWNTSNWSLIEQKTNAHEGEVASARFSRDGKKLVTASDDGTVKLWDASTLKLQQVFNGHKNSVWRAIFSPTSDLIASSGYDGEIILWDPNDPQQPPSSSHRSSSKSGRRVGVYAGRQADCECK